MKAVKQRDQEPRLLFANLKRVADTVVRTFGHHCEAVVHNLCPSQRFVKYISGDLARSKLGVLAADFPVFRLGRFSVIGRSGSRPAPKRQYQDRSYH